MYASTFGYYFYFYFAKQAERDVVFIIDKE